MADTLEGRSSSGTGTAEQVRERAATAAASARDEGHALVDQARQHGGELVAEARGSITGRADEQLHRVADTLRDVGGELHRMAEGGDQGSGATRLVRSAGERADTLADHLDGGVEAIGDDVRRWARQRPLAFLAGAAAAGFVVGRVVRNSNRSRLMAEAKDALTEDGQPAGRGNGSPLPMRTEPDIDLTEAATGPTVGAAGTLSEQEPGRGRL